MSDRQDGKGEHKDDRAKDTVRNRLRRDTKLSLGNFQGIPGIPLRQTGEFTGNFWELVGLMWLDRKSGAALPPCSDAAQGLPMTEWISHRASSTDTTLRPPGLGSVPDALPPLSTHRLFLFRTPTAAHCPLQFTLPTPVTDLFSSLAR